MQAFFVYSNKMLWEETRAGLCDLIDARELEFKITYEKFGYSLLWKHVEAYAFAQGALGEITTEQFDLIKAAVDDAVTALFRKTHQVHLGYLYERSLKDWIHEGALAVADAAACTLK
jgi:hypothetical protein